MKFQVTKEFRDVDGSTRILGDVVDLDLDRAALLRQHGLIGLIETADAAPREIAREAVRETTSTNPSETADAVAFTKRRKHSKK